MRHFKPEKLSEFVKKLQNEGKSSLQIRKELAIVDKFFKWALRRNILSQNKYKQLKDRFAEIESELTDSPKNSASDESIPEYQQLKERALNEKNAFRKLYLFASVGVLDFRHWLNGILVKSKDQSSKIKDLEKSPSNFQAALSDMEPRHYAAGVFLLILIAALGAGVYTQFFQKPTTPLAFPTNLTKGGRTLSFQGRLTDSLGNPIDTATNIQFKLYNVSTGGTELYATGTCSVTPDQDGVFDSLIGGSGYSPTPPQQVCGTEIPANIFSDWPNIYLGVTVGSDSEATPRQQIANVGYALNSETLQGFPPGTGKSTIPYLNKDGDLLVATSGASIKSLYESASFTIASSNDLVLQSGGPSAGAGDIILQATGSGELRLRTGGSTDTETRIFVDNTGSVGIGNTSPGAMLDVAGNILVNNGGTIDTRAAGTLTIGGATQTGLNLGRSGQTTKISSLTTNGPVYTSGGDGTLNSEANLAIARGGTNGSATPTAGAVAYGTGTAYAFTLAGSSGECLKSAAAGTPTWGACGSGAISGSGTTNFLAKFTAATAIGDSLIFDNGTNLGIATTGPDAKLDVLATTEQLRLTYTDGSVYSAHTVDSSGNLTIDNTGTKTVIADDLQINGSDILDSGGTTRITLGATTTLSNTALTLSGTGTLTSSAALAWDLVNSQTSALNIESGLLNLDTAGSKIGIGTTTPTSKLHVTGAVTGKALSIFDETGDQNIITASASGTPVFNVGRTGNLTVAAGGSLDTISAGSLTIGGSTQTGLTLGRSGQITTVAGTAKVANLTTNGPVYTSGGDGTLNSEANLAIARGGTNGSTTPTAGAVAYGTGTAYAFSLAGSSGECLTSGGAGTPTWATCSTGSITGSGTTNRLAKFTAATAIGDSGIDDTSNAVAITIDSSEQVGIGDATPDFLLDVAGTLGVDGNVTLGDSNTADTLTGNLLTSSITSGATTQTAVSFDAASLTTGELFDLTGTFAPADGSTNEGIDINITHTPTSSADNFRSLDLDTSDGTALANTIYGIDNTLTLTGNAAKIGIVDGSTVSSSSTTADTLVSYDAASTVTGIITSGTRNVYGLRSQPTAGAESTGGTTNVYGGYFKTSADVGAGGTVNGYGAYIANGTFDTDGTSTNIGLYVEEPTGADTNYAAIFAGGNVGIGTTAPGAALDVAGNILVNNGGTIDTRAAGTLTIGGTTQTGLNLGRSGQTTKISNLTTNGPVYTSGGDGTLNSEANLAIARGGTNGSATPTAGAVAYGTGTAYAFTLAGSSGECLKSAAAGTPTWGSCATGSITGTGTTNFITKFTGTSSVGDSLLFDDGTNVGLGTTTPTSKLHVTGAVTGKALSIFDETGDQNIITASASGTPVFNVGRTGNLTVAAGGSLDTISAGSLTIGGTTQTGLTLGRSGQITTVAGTAIVSNLTTNGPIYTSGGDGTLNSEANLAIARGGTNGSTTPTAGAVAYGTGTAYAFSLAGSSGECLKSAAAGTPTWGSCATGSITGSGTTNFISKFTSASALGDSLLFDNGTNVGIATTGPDAKLDVLTTAGEQLRLTYTDGSVYSAHTLDSSGNLTIDNTGTKTVVADDFQVTGGDILDSGGTTRITLGATTTLSNTTTTLSGTTTLTASSLATLQTAASVNWGTATTVTFTADNATINGSDVSNGDLTLQGTSDATRTTSYLLLQPTAGNVGIGTTAPGAALDVAGNILVNNGGTIDTRAAGTLTIGGTTQTGLNLGRSGQTTKISNLTTNGPVYTSGGDGTLNSEANLAIARGGTNGSATPTAGAVAYGTGTAYAFNLAGSSGECLKSGGAGTPTWATCSTGSITGSGTTNFLAKFTSASAIGDSLIFDNGTNLGIATTGPDAKLDVLTIAGEQLRLTYTDGSVYSAFTTDSSGNLTIDNTGTKTVIGDDLQVNGNDILDSGATSRVTLGATTTLTNTALNLTGTATLTSSAALAWDLANTQTSALNIEGGLLNLDTTNSRVGIGTTTPSAKLEVVGNTKITTGGLIATPGTPTIAGSTSTDSTNTDQPLGIAVQGRYAYVASLVSDSLSIIDISVPTSPVRVSTVGGVGDTDLDGANAVAVNGNYAYVGTSVSNKIVVVDVSYPAFPKIVGSVTSGTQLDNVRSMYFSGSYLYAVNRDDDRLTTIDVSNPTTPLIVSSSTADTTDTNDPFDIYVQGTLAYVAVRLDSGGTTAGARLTVFDISNPNNWVKIGSAGSANLNDARGVYVSGKYAYVVGLVSDSLVIFDISNPYVPTEVGFLTDGTDLNGAQAVQVAGKYAYITTSVSNSFTVIDVSNPVSPTKVTTISSGTQLDNGTRLALSGRYAYVTSLDDDLMTVVDLGYELPALYAGSLGASQLQVEDNASINNSLYVGGGIDVGGNLNVNSGIFSNVLTASPAAGVQYGISSLVTDTGVTTTGTDTTYGVYSLARRTGPSGGTINTYGASFTAVGDAGGTSTAIGLYATASGADNNYAGIFENGNVGIGSTTPSSKLVVNNGATAISSLVLQDNGTAVFTVADVSGTAANGFTLTGAAASSGVTLAATGSDTNIALSIDGKGSGALNLNSTGTGDVLIAGGSAATGCTVTNSTGDITCSKFIDSAGAGAYYLDPANGSISMNVAGDIQTDTNVVLSGGGEINSGGNNTITVNSGTATTEVIAGSSGGNTSLCVTFSGSTPGTCDGKVDAGTVDPPYTINGKKYATYMSSMTGVKEETTGTINVVEPVSGVGYRHVIDFSNEPEGSDLWLFAKTTDLKRNIGRLVPLLTPSTNTRVWYMIDEPSMRLIVFTSHPSTIAYRLTAPRFDDQNWANTRDNGGSGFVITDHGVLTSGDLPSSQPEQYSISDEQGQYTVKDSLNIIVQEASAFSKITVATVQAGILAVQQITTNTLSAIRANVQTLTASNKIISPVVETDQLDARTITTDSIQTGKISPKDQNVEVNLSNPANPQAGELAKLIIRGKSGQEVASIDSEGDVSARNATLSGTLQADNVKAKDASFSGTIVAEQVDSQNIRDFRNRLETVVSQTSDLGQQTSSVTQTTTNLSDQVNQIQSLLADLQNQPLPNAGYYQNLPSSGVQGNVDSQNNLILQGYNSVALNNLAVTGNANLANAYVINSLGVGNITVSNGQIATLDSELKISALSTVNFLDGAVIISRDGSLTTKGTLVAQGGIKTNDLKPLTDQDNLNVTLNGSGVNDPRFVIRNGSGEVASVDASGSARFKNLSLDSSLVATNSGAIIAAADNFTRNGVYGTAIETQAESAGLGVIQANESEIIIYNNNIKDNTLIYLTPTGSVPSGQLTVSQKQSCPPNTPSCKPYFKVSIGGTSHPDIRFNWLTIN